MICACFRKLFTPDSRLAPLSPYLAVGRQRKGLSRNLNGFDELYIDELMYHTGCIQLETTETTRLIPRKKTREIRLSTILFRYFGVLIIAKWLINVS